MAHGRDSRLALERVQKYLGTADVKISQLTEFYDCEPTLQPDSHRVEVLERKLRQSSVKDGVQEHHLRAVVNAQSLDRALQVEQLSRATFLERSHDPTDFPKLDFAHGGLTCLGGQSRVLAARNIPPWDRRWPVDLYHEDISSGLRMQLRDKLNVQAPLSDGEIFLTYQQLKRAGNVNSMSQWGAYLSENKEKNLHRVANTEWGMILGSLSLIPGLWQVDDFIGKLHKMQSLHVNSEYTHYLKEIKKCFGDVLGEDPVLMARLTTGDIRALQGAASGMTLEALVNEGNVLKSFSSSEQEQFYEYLRSRPYMIPTVFTFFQDDNLISQCAPMILRLIDRTKLVPDNGSREPDIKASLRHMFERESGTEFSDSLEIQVSESESRTVTADSHLRFELAYRQLWLYTIRHFLQPDHRKHRKIRFYVDKKSEVQLLAAFALTLRFSSESISILASREARTSRSEMILDETSGTRCAESSQKYGIPHPASWQWDRQLLYLDRIYSTPEKTDGITTFFVLQSVFYNFFGYPDGFTPVDSIPEPENTVPPTSPADNTGEHTSQNSTAQPNNSGHGTRTGHAQSNLPSFTGHNTSSTSTVDPDLSGNQETINKIDEILANLAQFETDTKRLQFGMPEILQAISSAKSEIDQFQNSGVNLPAEAEIPDNPDIWLEYMEKSLKTRITGLKYAHTAGLDLARELGSMKQLLQQSPLTTGRSLALAQAVDIEFKRYNFFRCQVEDDMSLEKQALSAVGLAKYLTEFGSIQIFDKVMAEVKIERESIESSIEAAQIDEKWNAALREFGTLWDDDLKTWATIRAAAPTQWTILGSLDVSSWQDLVKRHTKWVNEYHSIYKTCQESSGRYLALKTDGIYKAKDKLKMRLNELERNFAAKKMMKRTRNEVQDELTHIKLLEQTQQTLMDLLACRERIEKVEDYISGLKDTDDEEELEQNH